MDAHGAVWMRYDVAAPIKEGVANSYAETRAWA